MKFNDIQKIVFIMFLSLNFAGCTFIFQKGRRSDIEKIETLSKQLEELNQTKRLLEDRLSGEIKDKQVRLDMMEKGLVITFVADILFNSGKDKILESAYPILDKVARVLNENVPDLNIGIEGHTDNDPIKYSNWKSNWELSTARALSVLHYLVEQKALAPERVSAIGYGEYKPVASNETKEGRELNRRVEVVILPKVMKTKEVTETKEEPPVVENMQENLK